MDALCEVLLNERCIMCYCYIILFVFCIILYQLRVETFFNDTVTLRFVSMVSHMYKILTRIIIFCWPPHLEPSFYIMNFSPSCGNIFSAHITKNYASWSNIRSLVEYIKHSFPNVKMSFCHYSAKWLTFSNSYV